MKILAPNNYRQVALRIAVGLERGEMELPHSDMAPQSVKVVAVDMYRAPKIAIVLYALFAVLTFIPMKTMGLLDPNAKDLLGFWGQSYPVLLLVSFVFFYWASATVSTVLIRKPIKYLIVLAEGLLVISPAIIAGIGLLFVRNPNSFELLIDISNASLAIVLILVTVGRFFVPSLVGHFTKDGEGVGQKELEGDAKHKDPIESR